MSRLIPQLHHCCLLISTTDDDEDCGDGDDNDVDVLCLRKIDMNFVKNDPKIG